MTNQHEAFDPRNIDHVTAYQHLCDTGAWPTNVHISEREPVCDPLWVVKIQSKLASAHVADFLKLQVSTT